MEPLNILNQNGRGMLLYLKNDLSYQMMNEPKHTTTPQELIICKVNSEEHSVILAFTYKVQILVMKILEISITLKYLLDNFPSHLLVIKDFNYPKIEWDYFTSKSNDRNVKFIESIMDCFFDNM